MNFYKAVII